MMKLTPRQNADLDREASQEALARHLDAACKRHCAETGEELWGFTVAALRYLAEWLALSEPKLTKDFLQTLALYSEADSPSQIELTRARVGKTGQDLLAALQTHHRQAS